MNENVWMHIYHIKQNIYFELLLEILSFGISVKNNNNNTDNTTVNSATNNSITFTKVWWAAGLMNIINPAVYVCSNWFNKTMKNFRKKQDRTIYL